jgi:hypothetical protein
MFARVTQVVVNPERLRQRSREVEDHVIPALRVQPGYSGGLLLGNPESGKVLAVSLWETEQEMHATDEAISRFDNGQATLGPRWTKAAAWCR